MTDPGNTAFLIAAGRHWDSMFQASCVYCDDRATESFGNDDYCEFHWEKLLARKMSVLSEALMTALGTDI